MLQARGLSTLPGPRADQSSRAGWRCDGSRRCRRAVRAGGAGAGRRDQRRRLAGRGPRPAGTSAAEEAVWWPPRPPSVSHRLPGATRRRTGVGDYARPWIGQDQVRTM